MIIPKVGDYIRLIDPETAGINNTNYRRGSIHRVKRIWEDTSFSIGLYGLLESWLGSVWEYAEEPESEDTARKADTGKPRMDLLDRKWLQETASVLGFGAEKYDAHNWRVGLKYSRLVAAALRHLHAFNDGEDNDPESGLSHLAHASCCLMFLVNGLKEHPEMDDRYKK